MNEITRLLDQVSVGDANAEDQLLRMVHDELKRIAASKLSAERVGHTLQTTALVNEAYLRLFGKKPNASTASPSDPDFDSDAEVGNKPIRWDSRGHFFAAAAEAMRRILIDNARRKKRKKRGGNNKQVAFADVEFLSESSEFDLELLDAALTKLETQNATHATVVKLRYFAGMTIEQTADALSTSPATVKRSWAYSRAWLRREIGD